jgi:hypothetical protein
MNLPGFTAGSSLYSTKVPYRATPDHIAVRVNGVIPALGIRYCQNVVQGWVIENTLCGDCADFQVVCSRDMCWSVRVTPWQTECWEEVVW